MTAAGRDRRFVRPIVFAASLLAAAALPAAAHHIAEVAAQIAQHDAAFEPLDRAAPGFALATASGRPVRLSDFRGKVVVLDFADARCTECALQRALLAGVRREIDRTPMRALVAFVSIAADAGDVGAKDAAAKPAPAIQVIDQAGRLRARFHGDKFDPTDLILFVNALTNEPPGEAAAPASPARAAAKAGVPAWFEAALAALVLAASGSAFLLIRVARRR